MPKTLEQVLAAASATIRRFTPAEACSAVAEGALIVDVRSNEARGRDGVVPGSIHVPRTVLEWRAAPDSPWSNPHLRGRRLIVLCDHGYASVLAAAMLVEVGLDDAGDVVGGFEAWRAAGLPVAPAPAPPQPDELPGAGGPCP